MLETWWCEWPGWTNCCQNDQPNVAAMHALVKGVLALPEATGLLTPAQRATYSALAAILPDLPVATDGTYAAAEVLSEGTHNSEGPWLYGTHPFRLNTVGTAVAAGTNISRAVATWHAQSWMTGNQGWFYGAINAALLGLATEAFSMVSDRAIQPPPPGYRFPAFAQHYQVSGVWGKGGGLTCKPVLSPRAADIRSSEKYVCPRKTEHLTPLLFFLLLLLLLLSPRRPTGL